MTLELMETPTLMGRYEPTAVYYLDSDCVEYVKNDAFCIYDRIDDFLTLIFDETQYNLVGFKLKGFKCIFEKYLKPKISALRDHNFIDLAPAIESVFSEIGDGVFKTDNEARVRAYKAALRLAANDNVKLRTTFLAAA